MKRIVNTHYYYVGIDTGTHTGVAMWNSAGQKLVEVKCMPIHKAMDYVRSLKVQGYDIQVRFEDARLRTWFGDAGKEKLQGAGSIKRDCTIWQDFLEDEGISYLPIPPKNNRTKLTRGMFEKITGWRKATNEHSRDAAMLVLGM